MIPVTTLSSLGKCGLIPKKFFHPPKNVPNHYSDLFHIKRIATVIWQIFGHLKEFIPVLEFFERWWL